jgi:hypothetical protein
MVPHPIGQSGLYISPIWTPVTGKEVPPSLDYMGTSLVYIGTIQPPHSCNTYRSWFISCYVLIGRQEVLSA